MSDLSSKIHNLASTFATSIMALVFSSPLEALTGFEGGEPQTKTKSEPKPKAGKKVSGRLARRSEEDIAKGVESIVKLVKSHPDGLRAEAIREELSLDVRELPRLLADAVVSKQLTKSGNKRATTYFAGKPKAAKPTKPAKKAAVKPKKAAKKATKKSAKKNAPQVAEGESV